jgi:hypothetical protein
MYVYTRYQLERASGFFASPMPLLVPDNGMLEPKCFEDSQARDGKFMAAGAVAFILWRG